jgi:hypothetical protein
MRDVINVSYTHIHTKGDVNTNFVKRQIESKMISFKVVNNIAIPSCFDFTFVTKKEIINIISALQMAQAQSSLKSKA